MLVWRDHRYSVMVLFAVGLHLWWALMILIDQSALQATGLASIHRYIHSPALLTISLCFAASLAFIGLSIRSPWAFVLLLPQQVLLMMSAAGAVEAMWIQQYADGVLRPFAFIAGDQIYSVLGAIGHTTAIIAHATMKWAPFNGQQ